MEAGGQVASQDEQHGSLEARHSRNGQRRCAGRGRTRSSGEENSLEKCASPAALFGVSMLWRRQGMHTILQMFYLNTTTRVRYICALFTRRPGRNRLEGTPALTSNNGCVADSFARRQGNLRRVTTVSAVGDGPLGRQ